MIRHFRRFSALLLVLTLLWTTAPAKESALDLLLIGVDTHHADQPGRSDAMILVRADAQNGDLRMVSFLRDLYVPIPGLGSSRLNAAYRHGGEALLKQTLQENFGISVDRTITVHFSLLSELVDQLGGIEMEITQRELPHLNALLRDAGGEPLAQAGRQHINGIQALCYSRIRKIDSDFQRASRQQAVITAMLRQASALNPWQLMALAVRYLPRIRTDLTLGDLTALMPLAAQLDRLTPQAARVPADGAFREEIIEGMMVLLPDLDRCRTQLQTFLE